MGSAQRDRELVADLEPHRAGLGESQMMRVGRASCTDHTRLRAHEFQVGFVAEPPRFPERQHALVDLAGSDVSLEIRLSVRAVVR